MHRILALALLSLLAAAAPARAELLVHGGTVWTGDERGRTAEALLVGDDGRLKAVGRLSAVRATARTDGLRELDLRGGFLAPGFADQHVHVLEQAALGTLEPSWTGYDPAAAEGVRAAIFGYHAANAASGMTPEDSCTRSAVTEDLKTQLVETQEVLARQGLTTVVEAGLSDMGLLDALRELDQEGRLTVRHLVRVGWGCIDEAAAAGWRTGIGGSDWLQVLGVKLYSDGWLGPRSAALREPYADRPGFTGFSFLGPDRAAADVAYARKLGFNVTTHAIGDRGLDLTLAAYEANGVMPSDRYSVEHAQVLRDDLIARMVGTGAIASIQTSFATTDQRFAESALGPERAAQAYAWRTLRERGVRLAGGTDFPVEQLNPLWGVQRIVTRQEFDGTPPGGWHPEQRLGVEEALRLISVDDAFARLEEDERGVLRAGAYADFVVLREDPRTLPEDCLAGATVLYTMVNGRETFNGEQAYPPGDATCRSAAAPARGETLRVVPAAGRTDAPARPAPSGVRSTRCRTVRRCGPLTLLRVRGRVLEYRLSRPATVRIVAGRRVLGTGRRTAGRHRLRLPRGVPSRIVRVSVQRGARRWLAPRPRR